MIGSTEILTKIEPDYEVIINEPGRSFRWSQHDYPSSYAKWNYHSEFELHLITSSRGTMFVGDYVEDFFPGNLCLIGPNIPHHWTSNTESNEKIIGRDIAIHFTLQSVGLDKENYPSEMLELKKLLDKSHLGLVFEGEVLDKAKELIVDLGRLNGLEAYATFLKIMSILSNEVKCRELVSPLYQPNLNQKNTVWLQNVFQEISENIGNNIKLSDFSKKLGMSESNFSRFFRRNSGMNFSVYIRKLRIGRACSLLSETNNKIVDIGISSGFQNLSNFNRKFKNELGVTPHEYRSLSRLKTNVNEF